MRIPFPKTIPLLPLLVVLTLILCIQLIQGTDPVFAVLMLIAQIAAMDAFNHMGGMTHMAGAFCLFGILPTVTVPEITHLILGQPGDLNLEHPITTAGVCGVFFICVMIAAHIVSSVSHPVAFLEKIQFSITDLRVVSALSCIFAISIAFRLLTLNGSVENGSLLAAVKHFYPLLLATSVMLATYVRITTTGGESAVSWYIVFLLILAIVPGLLTASKEGMLTPLLCWFLVVASSRHRFSWYGVLGIVGVLFLAWSFVYPFSQNARVQVRGAETLSEKVDLIVEFIRTPSQFPDSISASSNETSEFGAATSKVNLVQRFSVLKSIDMLIDGDQKLGYTSIERYAPVLLSVVPHALWPDRPAVITSNELGHKAGYMNPEDTSTGIAIGSPALFFDIGGWLALIVYTLICYALFFFATVRLVGTSESGIWGLVPIGTEALAGGSTAPDSMFQLVFMFLGLLLTLMAVLKVVSYFTQALISRPIPTKV
jgi:hypothetical protein